MSGAPNPLSMPQATTPTAPPKYDPYTYQSLAAFDGSTPGQPIFVSVKGIVFDVTPNAAMYTPGSKYNMFAGKDGSKALAISSMSPTDAVPVDVSTLTPEQVGKLDGWYQFFEKRYNIIGKIVG
ncbi:cytochrome b5 [Clavulina sp. PMI_390]|nr:cytochrome b5 [Clavulina sp. PMI_390]